MVNFEPYVVLIFLFTGYSLDIHNCYVLSDQAVQWRSVSTRLHISTLLPDFVFSFFFLFLRTVFTQVRFYRYIDSNCRQTQEKTSLSSSSSLSIFMFTYLMALDLGCRESLSIEHRYFPSDRFTSEVPPTHHRRRRRHWC